MTLAIHEPDATTQTHTHSEPQQHVNPVQTLQGEFVPTRIRFHWWGTRKALTESQRDVAAGVFEADGDAISSGKQLINIRSNVYRALTKTKSQCRSFWKGCSLPFPEDGIRMIRTDRVEDFVFELELYKAQLESRVEELKAAWPQVLENAKARLGQLWNEADYPSVAQLGGLFKIEWDFPSVKPDEQLQMIDPALYEKERQKMVARFETAASMAEDMFMVELSKLVDHLVERLQPDEEGNQKTIRSSSVENLNAFFGTFEQLNLGGNSKLEGLVEKAKQAIVGVDVKELRKEGELKQNLSAKLAAVSSELDGMLVNKPRRKILD